MKQIILTALIAALCGAGFALWKNQDNESNLYTHLGGEFELKHINGTYTQDNLKGSPSVIYFGFTHCPDICPLALNKLVKVLDKIEDHNNLKKIFVSVDYKRDTPKSVAEYAQYFGSDFIGLTGNEKQIKSMTKKYAAHFEFVPLKDSALKFTVDHTSRFYLLDEQARIVGTYADIINNPQFLTKLKDLL